MPKSKASAHSGTCILLRISNGIFWVKSNYQALIWIDVPNIKSKCKSLFYIVSNDTNRDFARKIHTNIFSN